MAGAMATSESGRSCPRRERGLAGMLIAESLGPALAVAVTPADAREGVAGRSIDGGSRVAPVVGSTLSARGQSSSAISAAARRAAPGSGTR